MSSPSFEVPTSRKSVVLAASGVAFALLIGGGWAWSMRSDDDLASDELLTTSEPSVEPRVANAPPEPVKLPAELQATIDKADAQMQSNPALAIELYKNAAVRLKTRRDQAVAIADTRTADSLAATLKSVQERLRLAQSQPALTTLTGNADRLPHAPPTPGEVRAMTIYELGNFTYIPADDVSTAVDGFLPDDVRALDGLQVKLAGFMVPLYQTTGITEFTLVPDLYECCFGQPPGLEHVIQVELPEGKAVGFTYGQIEVTGTLKVQEQRRDGYVVNIFTLTDVSSVRTTGQ